MFNPFKKKKPNPKIQLDENTTFETDEELGMVKIVHDKELTGKENIGMMEFFSEKNNIPIFKETVKHAYESDYLGYKDKCPKCAAPTQQMMSNFAYATQEASRLLSSPAGHFCTECPTVIIDDDMMRAGIDISRFRYGGVFTIETGYSDEPMVFETLNGEKPVMILEEDMQGVAGILQSVHQSSDMSNYALPGHLSNAALKQENIRQQKKKSTNKRKNKAAKKARKRNRRK